MQESEQNYVDGIKNVDVKIIQHLAPEARHITKVFSERQHFDQFPCNIVDFEEIWLSKFRMLPRLK